MSGPAQFKAVIDKWLLSASALTVGVARGISVEMFEYATMFTPQYSGDMSGNWKYSAGSPDTSFQELNLLTGRPMLKFTTGRVGFYEAPYIMGDSPAIEHALSANVGRDKAFNTLGQTAYISNSAKHDDKYAWKVEFDEIAFREGNIGHVAQRTMSAMQAALPANIGKVQALSLSHKTFGGWA